MPGRITEWLNRPEYIYQPGKLVRRVFGRSPTEDEGVVQLPWNLPLEVDRSELLGRILSHHGIFELPVVEAFFRLIDPDETVLDVGANIGYMTAVAACAGAKRVISFEPHPIIFARLSRNLQRWNRVPGFSVSVEARQEAMSSTKGKGALQIPRREFAVNQCVATLENGYGSDACDQVSVSTTTIDSVINELSERVEILKIDIEGHEYQALLGAAESLSNGKIRDIIYEDFGGAGSDSAKMLARFGYSIFGLQKSVVGPVLLDSSHVRPWKDHNLLATLEPERAKKRMAAAGFVSLSRNAKTRFTSKRAL